jgi:hypothetical protein
MSCHPKGRVRAADAEEQEPRRVAEAVVQGVEAVKEVVVAVAGNIQSPVDPVRHVTYLSQLSTKKLYCDNSYSHEPKPINKVLKGRVCLPHKGYDAFLG